MTLRGGGANEPNVGGNLWVSSRLVGEPGHCRIRLCMAGALVASAQVLLLAAAGSGVVLTAGQGVYAPLLGEHRDVIATLAVCGWIGLTVAGSLLHLLPLMARVRRLDRPAPPLTRKRSDPIVAASAIAAVAALAGARLVDAQAAIGVATVAVLALYAILGSRVVRLALGAVRAAPLRI